MNSRNRQHRAFLRLLALNERQLLGMAARARNAYIRAAAKAYETHGQPPNHLNAAHEKRLSGLLDAQYRAVIPQFGALALKQVRRIQRKSTVSAAMQEWIRRQALAKAKMIAETDRDDVLNAIADGLEDGSGIAEIARNIRSVSQLTPFRAATIARTETHAAATYGSIQSVREAEQELGVRMVKTWLATKDGRTRADHIAASGQTVPLDEKFSVSGVLMDRPGDPSGTAANLVNCRCALVYSEAE